MALNSCFVVNYNSASCLSLVESDNLVQMKHTYLGPPGIRTQYFETYNHI